ncbi:MAG: carbohydrate ABC transporter permease [Anaerolineae bacterium]|nr:carbohydrate ABC transporter permease [Anaerolineae bacterium]
MRSHTLIANERKRERFTLNAYPLSRFIMNAVVIGGAVLVVIPFAWIVLSSFKPRGEIFSASSVFWPRVFTLENYQRLQDTPLVTYAVNSAVATLIAVLINLPVGALAGFGFSRFNFRGRNLLLIILLMSQLLPAAAIVIPLFLQLSNLRLLNAPGALGLTYAGLTVPLIVLLLINFCDSIPRELDEAAAIDGCNKLSMFWRIHLPLLRPGLAAATIFIFISTWQEFLLAISLTTKAENYTLPVGLFAFQGQFVTDWGGIMAMAVVIALPAVILFAVLQNQFVSSLTGAVKG